MKQGRTALHRYDKLTWYVLWIALVTLTPSAASAQAIEGLLCDLVAIVQDDIGAAVCTVAVMALGFQAALGRISWALPFVTAAGIVVLYSAADIAAFITGETPC